MVETANRMGTGAGGTRNISPAPTTRWSSSSAKIAELPARRTALVFTSGTCRTRLGILRRVIDWDAELPHPLGMPGHHQFHVEGVRPVGRREEDLPPHDADHLEELLKADRSGAPNFALIVSRRSIPGRRTWRRSGPVLRHCRALGAMTYATEVHGGRMYGQRVAAWPRCQGVIHSGRTLLEGTLAKRRSVARWHMQAARVVDAVDAATRRAFISTPRCAGDMRPPVWAAARQPHIRQPSKTSSIEEREPPGPTPAPENKRR